MIHSLSQLHDSATEAGGKKFYVLDTSVLLSDPQALYKFDEHVVLLPLVVITELEKKRHDPELGYFARVALRNIEDIQDAATRRDLSDIVKIPNSEGLFAVVTEVDTYVLPEGIDTRSNDAKILATACQVESNLGNVTLVSRDLPMRILASSIGVNSENYRAAGAAPSDWSGIESLEVEYDDFEQLVKTNNMILGSDSNYPPINTGVIVRCGTSSALAVYEGAGSYVNISDMDEVFEVKARSAEQKVALAHLLRDSVGIVSIGGRAGTGKSAMALLAGIQGVLEEKRYKKVVIFRPLYAVGGQDLGYLPGDHAEKMGPWAQAVFDTLEPLVSKNVIDELIAREAIEVLPLTHIRGRSLHDAFVIVDEAQSLERNVLLTVLSRMGQNSKIVLTHDVAQRDNLHVGRYDGILAVVEALKGNDLFAHVTLRKSERSRIAELVTGLLDF